MRRSKKFDRVKNATRFSPHTDWCEYDQSTSHYFEHRTNIPYPEAIMRALFYKNKKLKKSMKKLISSLTMIALVGVLALPSLTAEAANTETITVSATVASSLSLTASALTMALGALDGTFAGNTASVTFTMSTNSLNGGQLDMTSGGLKSATREIGVTDIASGTPQTAAADYYKISTNAFPGFTTSSGAISDINGADMLATQNLYNGVAPITGTTQLVTVGAQIDTSFTDAGTYADSLVATLTAHP